MSRTGLQQSGLPFGGQITAIAPEQQAHAVDNASALVVDQPCDYREAAPANCRYTDCLIRIDPPAAGGQGNLFLRLRRRIVFAGLHHLGTASMTIRSSAKGYQ
jgi:hypothetical protein